MSLIYSLNYKARREGGKKQREEKGKENNYQCFPLYQFVHPSHTITYFQRTCKVTLSPWGALAQSYLLKCPGRK